MKPEIASGCMLLEPRTEDDVLQHILAGIWQFGDVLGQAVKIKPFIIFFFDRGNVSRWESDNL